MISARRLSVVARGVSLIDDVSLGIAAGECVGLVGPSGSGKTALLQALAGVVRPTGGSIHLQADEHPADVTLLRRRVGYAAADAKVGHGLRVDEYLRFVAQIKAPRAATGRSEYTAVALRAGLDPAAAVAWLAPEQHAALAIAAAVVAPVSVLLIDHSIDALAPADRARMTSWLGEIRDRGIALLVATNASDVQLAVCQRVLKLVSGRVAEERHLTTAPVVAGIAAVEVT
jgi:ABC-type multidrug transport system ATPase subunit